MTLIEVEEGISKDNKVAETFKSYFETLVENLGNYSKYMSEGHVSNELVTDAIKKYQNHPCIRKTNQNHQGHFSFSAVELVHVTWEIDAPDAS